MADENEVRVYGMADQADRDPPAAEGLRGAKSSTTPQRLDPELSHQVALDTGKTVIVSEGSGTAWAEATGRAGFAEPKDPPETVNTEQDAPRRFPPVLTFAGLVLAAGIIILAARRLSARASRI